MATTVDPIVSAGAAPETPAAPQSDEQILGIESNVVDPFADKPEAAPAADATAADPAKVADPAKPADPVTEEITVGDVKLDLRRIPQQYREMVKSDPELAARFADTLALADLNLKLNDVKALHEALPEGVKSLETLKADIAEQQRIDAQYDSNDPAQQVELSAGMYERNPEATLGVYRAMSHVLAEKAPEQYVKLASEMMSSTLRGAGYDDFANSARQAIAQNPDSPAAKALGEVLDWMGERFGVGLPKEKQLDAREQALRERETVDLSRREKEESAGLERFNQEWGREADKMATDEI